jgi:hypothetical protein
MSQGYATRLAYTFRGEVLLKTSCEGTEEEQKFSYTLSVLSEEEGGGWSTPNSGHFTSGKEPRYSFYGGWVGLRVGLDGFRKPRPHLNSNPGSSRP